MSKKIKKKDYEDVNIFKYGYLPWSYITNIPHNIGQFFRNIGAAFERAVKGYSKYDVWNFDEYMTVVIANGLKELEESRHGFPAEMTDEEWSWTLQAISAHLLNSLEDNEDTKVSEVSNELWEKAKAYEISTEFIEKEDGLFTMETRVSDEKAYDAAMQAWRESEEDAWRWRNREKDIALDELKKHWYKFWD